MSRNHSHVQQHVNVLLADKKTELAIALTEQSANRLGLSVGKEVLTLIKAPWVKISKSAENSTDYDNRLSGRICSVARGAENSEVMVTLTGGAQLCSTLDNQDADRQQLKEGDDVTALFNADQVIIATLC